MAVSTLSQSPRPRARARKLLLVLERDAHVTTVIKGWRSNFSAELEVVRTRSLAETVNYLIAVDRTLNVRVDAFLMDLDLPDSQGIETFDRLFALAKRIPVLVIAGSQEMGAVRVAVHGRAYACLTRDPFDLQVLGRLLDRISSEAGCGNSTFEDQEREKITLDAIADGVICVDASACVTYCNPVAARLTGWSLDESLMRPFSEVFRFIDAHSRQLRPDPMIRAIASDKTIMMAPDAVLVAHDGSECAIEDSTAPIHDRDGRVVGAVIVFRDVSAARASTLKLSHLAHHDVLTDLPNRALLDDRLYLAIEVARRHHQSLAILFLDIDRFKNINDSLGHAIGDRLLQSVAQRLVGCVRSTDTVSRQGGDEFVILLPEVAHISDVTIAAEKVLHAIELPYQIDEHELQITASAGVVVFPEDGGDGVTLLKHADAAMYHAKSEGRGRFQFFTSSMNDYAVERQSIESGLRRAIKDGQLLLHYQPEIDLASGALVGAEALVRWAHPQRGMLYPSAFVPVAEESGLIVAIGRWVLREACRQARVWLDNGHPSMRLAVNTSAVELRTKDFVAFVRDILEETALPPEQLELEITETFLLQDTVATADILRAIADLGVHIALDDFGTGYSSLSHLKRFPIDALKIDRSFVNEITTDSGDASIVAAVVAMGRSLSLRVIAEGVETAEQASFLQAQECPEGQGWFFGKPMTGSDFSAASRSSGMATA